MKIKFKHGFNLILTLLIGFFIGWVVFAKPFFKDDPQTMNTYSNSDYNFKITYPKDFNLTQDEERTCYKTSGVGSQQVSNQTDIHLPSGLTVPLSFNKTNFSNQENRVFSGFVGYRYFPDCGVKQIMSLDVIKKESGTSIEDYVESVIFTVSQGKGYAQDDSEGPFRINKIIDGKKVSGLRFKSGRNLLSWTDVYYIQKNEYNFELSYSYNKEHIDSTEQKNDYGEEIRDYNLAQKVIDGFEIVN